jgi:hypothetical protein
MLVRSAPCSRLVVRTPIASLLGVRLDFLITYLSKIREVECARSRFPINFSIRSEFTFEFSRKFKISEPPHEIRNKPAGELL